MTTKEQVLENLRGFVEKCHDRKIVCLDNDAPPFLSTVWSVTRMMNSGGIL